MPAILPRFIRLRDAPFYLGMDRNRFNRDVRPYVEEISIGKQGVNLGETDRMFACMDDALAMRRLWYVQVEPLFDPYRSDPRFQAILEGMGLAD